MVRRLTVIDDGEEEDEGNEPEPRVCCEGERRADIDALYDVLPASSRIEIATRLGISEEDLGARIGHLRRNAEEHGWTIPHARRGKDTGEDRFFRVLVDKGGERIEATAVEMIEGGGLGTTRHIASSATHAAFGLRAGALHTRSPSRKAEMNDLAEDFEYLGRRAQRIADEWGEEANGG